MPLLTYPRFSAFERPRLSATSIRQLARLGTVVRWPGLVFAAILSLVVTPKVPLLLALVLLWVAAYNTWGLVAIPRADDGAVLRIGRGLILLDTISYFLVIAAFGGVGTSTSIYATYILLIVWMVAYDGAEGAMLLIAIFVLGMIGLHATQAAFFHQAFNGQDVLLWSLIMAIAGAILAAFDRIVVAGLQPTPERSILLHQEPSASQQPAGFFPAGVVGGQGPASSSGSAAVRLSPREQEVLVLVSEGCSNGMIAARLHLSENTVKTHVESLLSRLGARNRAEAVAAASRQRLI
ncbi:MAG: response regulator transcription factor [Candidatus Dormibacteraeota bacterium]|nr:response regulator transcription factor [Candidatus Dormibacteraeota bacterium]